MPKLTPRQRAYVRKRTAYHDPDPSEAMGELNIVPFLDIVVNLIIFLLATTEAVLAIARIDAQLPTLGRRVGRQQLDSGQTSLNLSVTLTRSGIIVSGSGGKLAPGCENLQSGRVITVPSQGGRLVWSTESRDSEGNIHHAEGPTARGLRECLERVKRTWENETRVILSADPEIEFENIVGAMDAMRGDGPDPLFPDVMLSAGVR
ncbi:MAG: biopolymer transporter ExbD [Myxococcales bacterium]|nr:biopolymer transporter ExbD [Myxococcales bacterium]